jgi:hypothetical protein
MSLMPTVRYGDRESARRYPLPVPGAADWQPHDAGWQVSLRLPDLPTGALLLPSLTLAFGEPGAAPEPPHRHRWTLCAGTAAWALQDVPARPGTVTDRTGDVVSTHIDCYHVHKPLHAPTLTVILEAPAPPPRYLLTVSARVLTIAEPPLPARPAAIARAPRPRSQLTAPGDIAHRICSPTCVSMVLDLWERPHDWLELAAECLDPATGMFGVWPLALAAAARRGSLGAVEAFADWQAPLAVLDAGVPLVTSIRFFPGELPGAPLGETAGHLLVLHGAGPERVRVCDPAAADGEVAREYPAAAFSRAWLRHRGAAYILPP